MPAPRDSTPHKIWLWFAGVCFAVYALMPLTVLARLLLNCSKDQNEPFRFWGPYSSIGPIPAHLFLLPVTLVAAFMAYYIYRWISDYYDEKHRLGFPKLAIVAEVVAEALLLFTFLWVSWWPLLIAALLVMCMVLNAALDKSLAQARSQHDSTTITGESVLTLGVPLLICTIVSIVAVILTWCYAERDERWACLFVWLPAALVLLPRCLLNSKEARSSPIHNYAWYPAYVVFVFVATLGQVGFMCLRARLARSLGVKRTYGFVWQRRTVGKSYRELQNIAPNDVLAFVAPLAVVGLFGAFVFPSDRG